MVCPEADWALRYADRGHAATAERLLRGLDACGGGRATPLQLAAADGLVARLLLLGGGGCAAAAGKAAGGRARAEPLRSPGAVAQLRLAFGGDADSAPSPVAVRGESQQVHGIVRMLPAAVRELLAERLAHGSGRQFSLNELKETINDLQGIEPEAAAQLSLLVDGTELDLLVRCLSASSPSCVLSADDECADLSSISPGSLGETQGFPIHGPEPAASQDTTVTSPVLLGPTLMADCLRPSWTAVSPTLAADSEMQELGSDEEEPQLLYTEPEPEPEPKPELELEPEPDPQPKPELEPEPEPELQPELQPELEESYAEVEEAENSLDISEDSDGGTDEDQTSERRRRRDALRRSTSSHSSSRSHGSRGSRSSRSEGARDEDEERFPSPPQAKFRPKRDNRGRLERCQLPLEVAGKGVGTKSKHSFSNTSGSSSIRTGSSSSSSRSEDDIDGGDASCDQCARQTDRSVVQTFTRPGRGGHMDLCNGCFALITLSDGAVKPLLFLKNVFDRCKRCAASGDSLCADHTKKYENRRSDLEFKRLSSAQ